MASWGETGADGMSVEEAKTNVMNALRSFRKPPTPPVQQVQPAIVVPPSETEIALETLMNTKTVTPPYEGVFETCVVNERVTDEMMTDAFELFADFDSEDDLFM